MHRLSENVWFLQSDPNLPHAPASLHRELCWCHVHLLNRGESLRCKMFSFWTESCFGLCFFLFLFPLFIWLLGLVVWFSLRVREVPGSIPGAALLPATEWALKACTLRINSFHMYISHHKSFWITTAEWYQILQEWQYWLQVAGKHEWHHKNKFSPATALIWLTKCWSCRWTCQKNGHIWAPLKFFYVNGCWCTITTRCMLHLSYRSVCGNSYLPLPCASANSGQPKVQWMVNTCAHCRKK